MIPGIPSGKQVISYYERMTSPSYTYPVTFYRNGSMIGVCPGSAVLTLYDLNNPPWSS